MDLPGAVFTYLYISYTQCWQKNIDVRGYETIQYAHIIHVVQHVFASNVLIIIIVNHHDIYSAVIIARVHSVHLVNVEQRQAAVDPQTKPHDLGCESSCYKQLLTTTTIAIYYYYSARKLILIYHPRRVEGWVDRGTAWRVHTAHANCKGCK